MIKLQKSQLGHCGMLKSLLNTFDVIVFKIELPSNRCPCEASILKRAVSR